MKIKNYDSFFKFALLISGDVQLNPGPTSDVCFVCKRTLNKRSFWCTKCDLRAHKKCNNSNFFNSDICSDCKRWENLPFHVSFCIDNTSDTDSSFVEDNLLSTLSHNEPWKLFKDKGMHYVNSLLSKKEESRTLAFNTNISVLGIPETKPHNTVINKELKIDCYNSLRSGRNKNGGGVACYIKNNIAHNRQSNISEYIENIVLGNLSLWALSTDLLIK